MLLGRSNKCLLLTQNKLSWNSYKRSESQYSIRRFVLANLFLPLFPPQIPITPLPNYEFCTYFDWHDKRSTSFHSPKKSVFSINFNSNGSSSRDNGNEFLPRRHSLFLAARLFSVDLFRCLSAYFPFSCIRKYDSAFIIHWNQQPTFFGCRKQSRLRKYNGMPAHNFSFIQIYSIPTHMDHAAQKKTLRKRIFNIAKPRTSPKQVFA